MNTRTMKVTGLAAAVSLAMFQLGTAYAQQAEQPAAPAA